MAEQKTKVLYIVGSGRSGSTILDSILGEIPGFAALGEVRYLWERGLAQDRACGCGEPFGVCDMWRAILDEAYGPGVRPVPEEMMLLQARALRIRHLPRMLMPNGRRFVLRETGAYASNLRLLYPAIARALSSRVIVDSSKLPPYGLLLDALPEIDLFVLHLVRDPRATAFSWMRHKVLPDRPGGYMERQSPAKAAGLWTVWNGAASRLWGSSPGRYLLLRYEDLIASPRESVTRIVRLVGEGAEELPFVSDVEVRLGVHHTVAGNPSRFLSGVVELRRDDAWISAMHPRDRRIVTAIAWPLMRRYGYSV